MLAHKMRSDKYHFPCYIQPKLNGIRGIYDPRIQTFQSRNQEIWNRDVVAHALRPLTQLGDVFFDGEFYCHGMSLQEINSRIAVTRVKPHTESDSIKFHVFDVITRLPFWQRLRLMQHFKKMLGDCSVHFVPTKYVETQNEWDYWHSHWRRLGYEGSMWRDPDAIYGLETQCSNQENRWWCLQKRKEVQDCEAVIVDCIEQYSKDGKLKNTLGAFQLRGENGAIFNAGSGLTDEQRAKYWAMRESMPGKRVRILFEMYSDNNVPLKPIIECVYD